MQNVRKCFFIDDDEDDREFLCAAVESIDDSIECVFAKDGPNAIELIANDLNFVPTLIFIDMNMPLMDGLEVLEKIGQFTNLNDVPKYLYSTSSSQTLIDQALEMGATEFLLKPSSMNELTELLRSKLVLLS